MGTYDRAYVRSYRDGSGILLPSISHQDHKAADAAHKDHGELLISATASKKYYSYEIYVRVDIAALVSFWVHPKATVPKPKLKLPGKNKGFDFPANVGREGIVNAGSISGYSPIGN